MTTALSDCPTAGEWRAYLDAEAPPDRYHLLDAHLAACSPCRAHLAELRTSADVVALALQQTTPETDETAAWRRLQAHAASPNDSRKRSVLPMVTRGRLAWRPVALAAAAVLTVAAFVAVTPLRTAAAQFLDVFRVRQIQVVSFDPDQATNLEERLFEKTVADEPVTKAVADAAEAATAAGVPVLVPASLPEGYALAEFSVSAPRRARAWVDLDAARALLESAGLPTDVLPTDPEARVISALIPAMVRQKYNADGASFAVVQVASPEMSVPEGLDVERIGAVGLRLLGYSAAEANALASSINWATTLVLPVPTGAASAEEVTVQGVNGYLLEDRQSEEYTETSVVWEKDDIIYAVSGNAPGDLLLAVARSLQ